MTKKEDEIAEAVTDAAKAEAEAEEAVATQKTTEAAATAVAASSTATAIAKEEAAVAIQRASADIQKNQEDNSWLKETVSNLHRNSEAQAQALTKTQEQLASLSEATAGIMTALTQQRSQARKTDQQVNPENETDKKDAEDRKAGKERMRTEPKKQTRRLI